MYEILFFHDFRDFDSVNLPQVQRQAQQLAVHQRFYAAMALQDLVQEIPLDEVASKFGASRGVLQTLQQSAATFAGEMDEGNEKHFLSCK